jgi:hypothetical protein
VLAAAWQAGNEVGMQAGLRECVAVIARAFRYEMSQDRLNKID